MAIGLTMPVFLYLGSYLPLNAESGSAAEASSPPLHEVFSGVVVSRQAWTSWAGGVTSFTGDLYRSGWRGRLVAGYGGYRFVTDGADNFANPALLEIMAGYQFRKGPVISKLYGGLHGEDHRLQRPDPDNRSAGMHYGVKLLSENWIDLPASSHAGLNLSYSTLNQRYQAQLRLGSEYLLPTVVLGPEAHITGNQHHYQLRFGGFLRWNSERGSIEASGGVARNYDGKGTPYLGASLLRRF